MNYRRASNLAPTLIELTLAAAALLAVTFGAAFWTIASSERKLAVVRATVTQTSALKFRASELLESVQGISAATLALQVAPTQKNLARLSLSVTKLNETPKEDLNENVLETMEQVVLAAEGLDRAQRNLGLAQEYAATVSETGSGIDISQADAVKVSNAAAAVNVRISEEMDFSESIEVAHIATAFANLQRIAASAAAGTGVQDAEAIAAANSELQTALSSSDLDEDFVADIQQLLTEYDARVVRWLENAIAKRAAMASLQEALSALTVELSQKASAAAAVQDDAIARQDTIGEANARMLQFWLLASVLVVAVAGLWLFFKAIGPIRNITRQMAALADGRLDVTLPSVPRRTEIGAMARAMRVFLDAMTAQREAQSKEEARQTREAEAAREQNAASEAFISNLETVLTACRRGDFSSRVQAEDALPMTQKVADAANQLIDAIDATFGDFAGSLGALAEKDLTRLPQTRPRRAL